MLNLELYLISVLTKTDLSVPLKNIVSLKNVLEKVSLWLIIKTESIVVTAI